MSRGIPMVDACPNCDSPKIVERTTKTPAYRCGVCRERFDEPVTRGDKNHTFGTDAAAVDDERYAALIEALRRTRTAGSAYARSKLIAQYSDELTPQRVAQLCAKYAEARGDVERYREASLGIVWRITVDEQPAHEREASA